MRRDGIKPIFVENHFWKKTTCVFFPLNSIKIKCTLSNVHELIFVCFNDWNWVRDLKKKWAKSGKKALETCMSNKENTSMWQVLIEWWFSSSFQIFSEKRIPQKTVFPHFANQKSILLYRGCQFSRRYQVLFVAQALLERSHMEFLKKLPHFLSSYP